MMPLLVWRPRRGGFSAAAHPGINRKIENAGETCTQKQAPGSPVPDFSQSILTGFACLFPVCGAGFSDNVMLVTDYDKEQLKAILSGNPVVAVVGASPNPARPSNRVAAYLIEHGFEVIPVRPRVNEILGRKCYVSLAEIPRPVDIVDVFRRAEACPDIARAAVRIGARMLWLQEGIISEEAAAIAREGGLEVIMDRCIKKVHRQIFP